MLKALCELGKTTDIWLLNMDVSKFLEGILFGKRFFRRYLVRIKRFTSMKILGYILFTLSFVAWLAIALIPFTGLSIAQQASASGGLFIFGEITFWTSLTILGKEFWQKIKDWFWRLFYKPKV